MKRPQWITLGLALLSVIGLFAATQASFFGERKRPVPKAATSAAPHSHEDGFGIDSILYYAKKNLPPQQATRLTSLENSIVRGNVPEQKLHLMHRLARYWKDSTKAYTPLYPYPYAWYTAEAARLEDSEKSLSFAAHLFLGMLRNDEAPQVVHWEAEQAKELFEKTLAVNPQNDSAKVGLGAAILYGGLDMPMKGIGMIREVAEKDPANVFAQLTLAEASLTSGQLDKAVERFNTVLKTDPGNLQAGLLLADTYEKMGKKDEAVKAYQRTLPFMALPEMKKEVEKRISDLKK